MKHAVIMTGGKQYRVAENDVIYVEKLNVADGETVTFIRFWPLSMRASTCSAPPLWKAPP